MNKILVGVIVGAVLGLIDGATAWFTPEVRSQMLSIIIGSTLKGVLAGVAAGWYARRVQSVPKGIAFGFAVGLLLAFLVAAMPSETGEHYWWQIMVPGSILGGVIGWATQRYGRPAQSRYATAAIAMFAMVMFGATAQALDHDHETKPAENAAFEKIKALAGKRTPAMFKTDGDKTNVEYRVSAGGTAVIETMFAGEPHEMVTVYTLDGDSINATHYCSGGNQPSMRLNKEKTNGNEVVFDFVSITGKKADGHIKAVRFRFDGDKVEEVWSTSTKDEYLRLFY
jgi:predicted membrane-bound mannosyltransferase